MEEGEQGVPFISTVSASLSTPIATQTDDGSKGFDDSGLIKWIGDGCQLTEGLDAPDERCGDETLPEQNPNSIAEVVINIMSAFDHVRIQEGGEELSQRVPRTRSFLTASKTLQPLP